jgi:predicted DNA-binding transcriptional regulator AlpA
MGRVWNFAMLENGIDDGWPETGFVRLPEIMERVPMSKTTWYKGIKEGKHPKPTDKFGPKISAWDVNDIRAYLGVKLARLK